MDILLIEKLTTASTAWLAERHGVECRPELAADPAALRGAVYRAQALVLPRKVVVTRELLDFAPRLRVVARLHGGTDNTDLQACRDRGVRVLRATAASVRSNAEFLLASLLLLYRRGIAATLAGQRHAEPGLGREINGSVVGILGLGSPAQLLAPMLRALGARLVGYDPAVHPSSPLWARLRIQPVALPQLLAQADAVSVQMLYASRYQGLIGDAVLAHCRKGQLWVGLSRSALFDAPALARALGDGRIAACVLDGAEAGFASRGTPLHEAANLFLTPRLGAHTEQARQRAAWYVAHRLHEMLAAPPPLAVSGTQAQSLLAHTL